MNGYNEKKKFKHKFLVFIIILLIINGAFLPFTFKGFKTTVTDLLPASAPTIEEYNYSDQEFVNLIYEYGNHGMYKSDADGYYFYYDEKIINVPALLDEAINNSDFFKNRNEVITYILKTKQRIYSNSNGSEFLIDLIPSIYSCKNKEEKVTIDNKVIVIGFYRTENTQSYSFDFNNIILPEVEAFYKKGGNN